MKSSRLSGKLQRSDYTELTELGLRAGTAIEDEQKNGVFGTAKHARLYPERGDEVVFTVNIDDDYEGDEERIDEEEEEKEEEQQCNNDKSGRRCWTIVMSSDLTVHAVLLVINLIYGLWHTLAHRTLEHLHPLALTLARTMIANVPLCILACIESRVWTPFQLKVSRTMLMWSALLGFLLASAAGILLFYGNELAGAANTAAMQPTLPVVTALLSYFCGRQKLSIQLVFGVLLTVSGALVLADVWELSIETSKQELGLCILAIQVLVVAVYLVIFEWIVQKETLMLPLKSYFFMNLFGSLYNLGIGFRTFVMTPFAELDAWDYTSVIYGMVFFFMHAI